MAGAVLQSPAAALAAQQPAPRPPGAPTPAPAPVDTSGAARATLDSVSAQAARHRDSLEAFRKGDTVRAPFAQAESPRSLDIGVPYRWDREAILESGANTLADLLERVPGALGFRVAWLVDQETATFLGDFRRVRVYVDGLPFAPPDLRGGGVLDLTAIQLWQYESCTIERGAGELRVYLRSWRVNKTIPYTRVDVYTGDLDANTFRGYFGQRFGPGFGLQVAGENLSIAQSRQGGDGSRRAGMMRLGWAGGRWSIDAFQEFASHFRREQARQLPQSAIPTLSPSASMSYLRVAWGDPDEGTWGQLLASTSAYAQDASEIGGTIDTTRRFDARRAQYALLAGTAWRGFRVSGGVRALSFRNQSFTSPQLRLGYEGGRLAVQAYAERATEDSTTRGDVTVRLLPRPWLAVSASYGGSRVSDTTGRRVQSLASRAELGIRVRPELWLTGGLLRRDSAWVVAPTRYDTLLSPALTGPAQATFVGLRGRIHDELFADIIGLQWDQAGAYRPRYQTRAELYLKTRWLHRFPSGAFGLLLSIAHEYKEPVQFPNRGGTPFTSGFSRNIVTKLEIRILNGVISWQWRNVAGEFMDQVPGALLPRANSVYGVRWEFAN